MEGDSNFDNAHLPLSSTEPPSILEKPESMDVLPGSKVQFNVLSSGTPPLTMKWFKDKKEILSGSDCSVTKDNTSTSLELFFAKALDSGDYICEINNDVGSDACQAMLFVKGSYCLLLFTFLTFVFELDLCYTYYVYLILYRASKVHTKT